MQTLKKSRFLERQIFAILGDQFLQKSDAVYCMFIRVNMLYGSEETIRFLCAKPKERPEKHSLCRIHVKENINLCPFVKSSNTFL